MTRAELKRNAREKLGGKLFGPNWVNAVLVMAIFYILTTAINGITGLGCIGSDKRTNSPEWRE